MSGAYYNEFDKFAADWLRELIKAGLIAPGEVDDRSIEDVLPSDLRGFTQCHFFAGIGVWSAALRRAGWSDSRAVWTMSCPCQPFSAAGKGDGFTDERHLWPHAFHLITQCRPSIIIGEQVASKAVNPWIDLVHADVEAMGYAFGCVPFPAAGVGAPHLRDRAYWVAVSEGERSEVRQCDNGELHRLGLDESSHTERLEFSESLGREQRRPESRGRSVVSGCGAGGMEHAGQDDAASESEAADYRQSQTNRPANIAGGSGVSSERMADADGGTDRRKSEIITRANVGGLASSDGRSVAEYGPPGPTNGQWRDADWLFCRDGKWRPVEPATFPLADAGTYRNRVAELRGAGNAINVEAARAFIETIDTPVNPAP